MPNNEIKIGKFFAFLFCTFVFGLLQLWIMAIWLCFADKSLSLGKLMGDGGIYFFSTGLAFSSFVSLTNFTSIKFGDRHFNFTAVVLTALVGITITAYVTLLSGGFGTSPSPFSDKLLSQFVCLSLSSIYAFYVALITGMFGE